MEGGGGALKGTGLECKQLTHQRNGVPLKLCERMNGCTDGWEACGNLAICLTTSSSLATAMGVFRLHSLLSLAMMRVSGGARRGDGGGETSSPHVAD